MSRFLRYLRITWTVFCGIACVLLIALWVRSYRWQERIVIGLYGEHGMQVSHVAGQSRLTLFNAPGLSFWQTENSRYGRDKMSVEEWRATTNPEVTSTSPSFLVARVPIGSTLHNGWTLHLPYWFIL